MPATQPVSWAGIFPPQARVPSRRPSRAAFLHSSSRARRCRPPAIRRSRFGEREQRELPGARRGRARDARDGSPAPRRRLPQRLPSPSPGAAADAPTPAPPARLPPPRRSGGRAGTAAPAGRAPLRAPHAPWVRRPRGSTPRPRASRPQRLGTRSQCRRVRTPDERQASGQSRQAVRRRAAGRPAPSARPARSDRGGCARAPARAGRGRRCAGSEVAAGNLETWHVADRAHAEQRPLERRSAGSCGRLGRAPADRAAPPQTGGPGAACRSAARRRAAAAVRWNAQRVSITGTSNVLPL